MCIRERVHIADPGAPMKQGGPEGSVHIQTVETGQKFGVRILDQELFRGGGQGQRIKPHFLHGHLPAQHVGGLLYTSPNPRDS